jgi:putative ABC transport system permease protein
MVFIVGVLSGSYPSYMLSRFTPARILRGDFLIISSKTALRKILVTIQFIIAIGLLCCTFEIYNQINHAFNTDLGFDKDNIVLLNFGDENITVDHQTVLKDEILKNGFAASAASASCVPGEGRWALYSVTPENKTDQDPTFMHGIVGDRDFIKTFGLAIVAGEDFSPESFSENSKQIIINQTALKEFEIENPIGFNLLLGESAYRVIGVVKDFHMHSLHNQILPIGIFPAKSKQRLLAIKTAAKEGRETLTSIKQSWEGIIPGIPFDYTYLDDAMAESYRDDRRLGSLFTIFSLLTVFISCLGLFGLAVFNTEQRTKEVGIRKVLGASLLNIINLLSREIIVIIIIANILAWPLAYMVMTKYLESFAYHADIHWLFFALSGILALAIALVTISFQAVKAALSDPVKTLRYE